jgi:L,D-transpeptidase ErfK/SrfK
MRLWVLISVFCCTTVVSAVSWGQSYVRQLCDQPSYECFVVQAGQRWQTLFPDIYQRDVVKRLNRSNQRLSVGKLIAVPKQLHYTSLNDISPFHLRIESSGQKQVLVDLRQLAWGAYDESGRLVRWGPASGGKSYCADVGRGCRTVLGEHAFYRKGSAHCASSKYPLGKGGAPMPYCMFFKGGFAIHGSAEVPGYNASHGCVRVFTEDARWLNKEFISLKQTTKVVVLPYY